MGGLRPTKNGKDRPTNLVGPNPQVFSSKISSKNYLTSPYPLRPGGGNATVAPKPGEWEEEIESSKEQELAKTIRGIRPAWTMRKILDAIKKRYR